MGHVAVMEEVIITIIIIIIKVKFKEKVILKA